MPDVLLVFVGAAAGGVAVWLWVTRRMRDQLQAELAESARKAVRAVDWAKSEAAMQVERRDQEIANLRASLDEREHGVEQARTRLQADLALAQRERAQWESRTGQLSTRADELSGQLHAVMAEGLRDLERLHGIARSLETMVRDYTAVLEAMDVRLRPAGGKPPVRSVRVEGSRGHRPG